MASLISSLGISSSIPGTSWFVVHAPVRHSMAIVFLWSFSHGDRNGEFGASTREVGMRHISRLSLQIEKLEVSK
ncbi:hypothetical protein PG996_016105 [Apiospora saccharicola]|uniref:Uncharacterized protein n=1 Tax=Apiospora saccharicola TaxID=335842 RepID=A0ABR1TMY6_9PEZI